MNERIEELARQSKVFVADAYGRRWEINPEKFAELIVQECAGACESATEEGTPMHLVSLGYAQRVKEHFGVKE